MRFSLLRQWKPLTAFAITVIALNADLGNRRAFAADADLAQVREQLADACAQVDPAVVRGTEILRELQAKFDSIKRRVRSPNDPAVALYTRQMTAQEARLKTTLEESKARALAFLGGGDDKVGGATTPITEPAPAPRGNTEAPRAGESEPFSTGFRKAAHRILPSVVTVRPKGIVNRVDMAPGRPLRGFGARPLMFPNPEISASGVIIDAEKGYVLTNDHVIQTGPLVSVVLHDGRELPVTEIRRDYKSNLALLVIEPKDLTAATWGSSEALDAGDWVLAIGRPFGLSGTIAPGVVGGRERQPSLVSDEDLLQTNASVNPENSGGPLVNLKGEVVGINSLSRAPGGGYQGVGFAIPETRARRVAAELAQHGRVRRAYLGINIDTADRSSPAGPDQAEAIKILRVFPDSPADAAGLRTGDKIVQVDGRPIQGLTAFHSLIEVAPIGKPLALTIDRDGEKREIKVEPKEQPPSAREQPPITTMPKGFPFLWELNVDRFGGEPFSARYPEPPPILGPAPGVVETADVRFPALGFRLSEPTPDLSRRFRLNQPKHGLVILEVEPNGPADLGGLEAGMVITDVLNEKVSSLDDFRDALDKRPAGRDLVVRILKGAKAEFRVIPDREEPAKKAGTPEQDKK